MEGGIVWVGVGESGGRVWAGDVGAGGAGKGGRRGCRAWAGVWGVRGDGGGSGEGGEGGAGLGGAGGFRFGDVEVGKGGLVVRVTGWVEGERAGDLDRVEGRGCGAWGAGSTHDEDWNDFGDLRNRTKRVTCVGKDPLLENDWNEDLLLEDDRNAALLSLKESGKLDDLLLQGKEYILVLNSDNFTEAVDPNILNHLIKNKIKYCMELEEKSWTPATLNSWVNINSVANNPKTKLFGRPIAATVPVSRNVLLEKTSDLLILKSDLYTCDQGILVRNEARINPANPTIKLGPEFEKITDFESRFKSIPSIIVLENLKVTGDVWFGSDVSVK
ncbi:UTP--glucose-1-phosphate uridylyltransferase-like protein, partial [Tanacetum coccineum]